MREVGVLEAKTHFSSLLDEVERGGEVVITRNGRPVARLLGDVQPVARARRTGEELVAGFRALRERICDRWPEEAQFDWKAAVEEGRE